MDKELFTAQQCLAFVDGSPAAVAAHDREAWLALFAPDAVVEDPVGSAPHRRGGGVRDPLGPFYDTFIAANDIRFEVRRDCVCGLHVMRDLSLEITMSPRLAVRVPMHLLYELTPVAGELKIARLAAHWELGPMLRQQIASGPGFLTVGTAAGLRMLRHLGVRGVAGFGRAVKSAGESGKALARRVVEAFNNADADAMAALFDGIATPVAFPFDTLPLTPAEFARQGGVLQLDKLLAAGDVVTATASYSGDGSLRQGVALFECGPSAQRLRAARFYWS